MPWKECQIMDERLRFVARLLEGEKMTALCAEFGVSRRLATRSTTATRIVAWSASATAAGVRSGKRISFRHRLKRASCG
jgi:putative transposase